MKKPSPRCLAATLSKLLSVHPQEGHVRDRFDQETRPKKEKFRLIYIFHVLSNTARQAVRLVRPSLPVAAVFSLGAVSAFAQQPSGGAGSLDLSSITNFFLSIATAYRGWVILAIVLLGLAGLVMMIQSRTRTIGLGMAVIAMIAGISVGIVTKHVNDNTGSSIQLE
jgi:hypothetical protein